MTPEEHIIQCETKLLDAIKTSNIEMLDELLHDELIFNIPTGQTITKAMDLENYRAGVMTVYDIATRDRIVKIMGAISTVAVTVVLKAKYADQPIDGTFRYLRVWKMVGNSWKVIAGSSYAI